MNKSTSIDYSDIKFNTKEEFINFIKSKLGIDLTPSKNDDYIGSKNSKKHILYTKLPKHNNYGLFSLFRALGLRTEEHLDNYYWIWIKDFDKN